MPTDSLRHLVGQELDDYHRFEAAFPDRRDVRPFRTDAPTEVDSWVAAGEPAVWPPSPAVSEKVVADPQQVFPQPEPVAAWTAPSE